MHVALLDALPSGPLSEGIHDTLTLHPNVTVSP